MLRRIMGLLQYFKYKPKRHIHSDTSVLQYGDAIPTTLKELISKLKLIMNNDGDLVIRSFKLSAINCSEGILVYINGLTDKKSIELNVLKPLMAEAQENKMKYLKNNRKVIDIIINEIIQSLNCSTENSLDKIIEKLLGGSTILFLQDEKTAIIIDAKKWDTRGVNEPDTESVVRGPREGFNEDLITNITLIRRKVKSAKLKFEETKLGRFSKTRIVICYFEGIADKYIINELKGRLERIEIDAILESGYIEQFIEDHPLSPFPTVSNSEKPDVVVGKLLEGRVAVLCDGTPFVLLVPRVFIENLQVSEDYYTRPLYATILRILRLLALFITTTLPALYVAVQTFHHEIIPFRLFIAITAVREGIPMPTFFEALMMVIIFELIKEAGLRMPKPVGQAVSIVGAIVLGQATVEAGIASPLMVIVIALTAITGFIVPPLDGTVFFLRICLLIAGSILGFYGIIFALVVIFIHMCNMKSFGVEFLSPLAPISDGLKDTYIRPPLWSLLFDNTKFRALEDHNPTEE
ncbi:spore germination protein [Alkaliphilus peptidifermentans]|uniref:Spore germination protein KA n=1 Tax=Alkaliphilus peptidifermentans DSM 18978 TaxID=1120976 RepID=A0A1G5EYS0_9FIRM|nr:spore germination protein [Alkaliphilus peptidifermentans]SCY32112.1 spore germination protein KA [Alkaliphilus peptidifermentans DSM 18978]